MKLGSLLMVWFLIGISVTPVKMQSQDKGILGDFTRSPTEHIINQIDQPFNVRTVRGTIRRAVGDAGPLPDVLFEIQGPGADKQIRRATADKNGRFKIGRVPAGTYRFKATLDGFQSVMGTVIVSKEAARANQINLKMQIGV